MKGRQRRRERASESPRQRDHRIHPHGQIAAGEDTAIVGGRGARHEHGARCRADHALGHAAEHQAFDPGSTVGTDNDQVAVLFLGVGHAAGGHTAVYLTFGSLLRPGL